MEADYEIPKELARPEETREFYVNLVDSASSADDIADIITLISTLNGPELEASLPSLCHLAAKCPDDHRNSLLTVVFDALAEPASTRASRKACFSCMKLLVSGAPAYGDFFVLAECLEEPQFHIIRPVLPRMDGILGSVSSGVLHWKYAALVLIRALYHSNGWIRLWALEKLLDVNTDVLATNSVFITQWLFPSLNSNDLLWRLLERNRLTMFFERFGDLIAEIVSVKTDESRASFLRSLLEAVEGMSCPLSFYYISVVLDRIQPCSALGESDAPLFRRVVKKAQYIQYSSLKSATLFSIVSFIARITIWSFTLKKQFGALIATFSQGCPQLLLSLRPTLDSLWSSTSKDFCVSKSVDDILLRGCDEQLSDSCYLLWLEASQADRISQMLSQLSLLLSDALSENSPNTVVVVLISCLLHAPEEISVVPELVQAIVGHVMLQVAVAEGRPDDFVCLRSTYLPFLRRFSPVSLTELPEAVYPSVCKEEELPTERRAILCSILSTMTEESKMSENEMFHLAKKYLGSELLALPRFKKSIPSLSTKEFANIISDMHTDSLNIYLRLISHFSTDPDVVVDEAIDQLDCASAYSVKERLLTVIAQNVDQVISPSVQLAAVKAGAAVVNEEKKSLNCLPAMAHLFNIVMQKNMMKNDLVAELVEALVDDYIETASLSVSISLVLANAMKSAEPLLTERWARQAMRISVFGPVPKKEHRVLSSAYESIYHGKLASALPSNDMDRLHEVIQRARMISLCVAVQSAERCPAFAAAITAEILIESSALDKSSSKSFGLSLAHRQKTRAVALLLFVTEYVVDEAILLSVFNHCIECIVDPCQQFSIKLIVEWILVRICLRSAVLKERLLSLEKELSNKRIGSISSWINTLLHLYRVENNQECFSRLIALVLPWTTAQNFGVRCTAIAAAKLMFSSLDSTEQDNWKLVKGIIEFDSEPAGNSRRIIDNLCDDFYFAKLNMRDHLDMRSVLLELPAKTGMPHEETIRLHLIEELNTTSFRSNNTDERFLSAPSEVYAALGKTNCAPDIEFSAEEEASDEIEAGDDSVDASLQRKIVTKERRRPDDCSMIVVASLIDKPNNLGGLCRTSEIFGVESLVISDLQLAADSGFKALSMSSEHWQKMEAVRPDQLLPYLDGLRAQGYTVIAAEQTTDSVPMHKFTFPKKCALLMGDEKEGVPTRLLRCVDQTVEIEQLGQTRSLNVHVTAALFISKYAEQVLLR